ncbi:MAG: ACP S-malonyltransferase, partial [Bacilli bacterium]
DPTGVGTMAAVLGLSESSVAAVTQQAQAEGLEVDVANANSPLQTVVSGRREHVELLGERLKEQGAKRFIPLPVAGAFHSRFMREASEKFETVLQNVTIETPSVPVYSNVTAAEMTSADDIRMLLAQQLYSTVRWTAIIEQLIAQGHRTFVEIGPGKVLAGLVKAIDRSLVVHNVSDVASLDAFIETAKGEQ